MVKPDTFSRTAKDSRELEEPWHPLEEWRSSLFVESVATPMSAAPYRALRKERMPSHPTLSFAKVSVLDQLSNGIT